MTLSESIQRKLDGLTKPVGSLGQLEAIAHRVAMNQKTTTPSVTKTLVSVFAADHGLAEAGVSAFPQEVTIQMVANFLNGGAAINVLSEQAGAEFELVDCGTKVSAQAASPAWIDCRIASGTANMLNGPAMSDEQFQQCLSNGGQCVNRWVEQGINLVALGEMGIGNTSSAALLMSALTGIDIELCTGRGTGHDDEGLNHKTTVLKRVQEHAGQLADVQKIGAYFGGFEIVTLAGVILAAKDTPLTLIIDGFIVSAAALLAERLKPGATSACLFAHVGAEKAHAPLLHALNADPVLALGLRLGEGSGAALAIPIVQSAVAILNRMASFESAGVSEASA